jgi:cellulose synthase/poly-beta-1,6-N-acetylglucosamine synthase-like glycosyltransferase
MKVAIVTPYYKEPREMIERCIRSVAAQDVPATHFVVSDGHPQDWIDGEAVRHLRLGASHGDYGNTPRSIGGILAASEGFDAIGFVDADNWLETAHVSTCLRTAAEAAAAGEELDYVVARRRLVRNDGSVMNIQTRDDHDGTHVDTNCFFMLPGSFHALGQWGVMPKPLSVIGDRIFVGSLRAQGLRSARSREVTVNYLCTWAFLFEALGETPPDYAKSSIDMRPTQDWWHSLDERDRAIVDRLAASPVRFARTQEPA